MAVGQDRQTLAEGERELVPAVEIPRKERL